MTTTALRPRPAPRAGRPGRSRSAPAMGRHRAGYLFVAPFFVVFVVFQLAAIVMSFGMSLTNWKGAIGGQYVALGNYLALFTDQAFVKALWHTAVVWVVTVPALSLGGLVLAHLLNSRLVRAKSLLRTLLFIPVLPALVVVGVIFLLLLDPVYGLPNLVLDAVGLPVVDLRNEPAWALPVLIAVIVWRWLGYNMVIHLAALQSLPGEVLESARVDGANAWQTFWKIIVPMSRRTLVFTSVLSTIAIFSLFDEPYVLFGAEAGPDQAGLMLGTYMYKQGFEFFNLGYASAISYTIAVVVFIVSMIQLRVTRDD